MNWDVIKSDIAGLKSLVERAVEIVERQDAELAKVKADLAAALARDTLDPADVQAVHDGLAAYALEVESKLHARTM